MLDVLLGENIHDTAVVVTRYFGGTLLGTGGLVRAYSAAVREGLSKAVILDRQPGIRLAVQTDYNGLGKIQYILNQDRLPVLRSEYTDSVLLEALIPVSLINTVTSSITEATSGQALLTVKGRCMYALSEGEVLLFEEEPL